ncbi:hypothetical protein [Paucidesulfovibrio longus]|uniref:hypothetical protein n=1 Tax=Paucidesulfovibrio longus TaxID=889 RepID=UPI0003B4A883|nr:hypothetical protein [Paucidesulfovibrio longus]
MSDVKETPVQEVQEKVFPISTFVNALRGADQVDAEILEFLSFVTQSDVSADLAPVAAGLSKGYIYEVEPSLTKQAAGDLTALGNKVKLAPLAGAELSQAQAALGKLAELQKENAALKAEVAKLTSEKSDLDAQVKSLAAKVKVTDDANKAGESKIALASSKIDDMVKKLNALMEEVNKVKEQGVVVAGAAGGGADAGAAAGASSDAPSTGGEPEADFGFGSNPFADSEW